MLVLVKYTRCFNYRSYYDDKTEITNPRYKGWFCSIKRGNSVQKCRDLSMSSSYGGFSFISQLFYGERVEECVMECQNGVYSEKKTQLGHCGKCTYSYTNRPSPKLSKAIRR
jgi:hypothetical protein